LQQAFRRLVGFLRSLGVDYVFDVSVGRELTLLRVRLTRKNKKT
jgi:hypothetical protein